VKRIIGILAIVATMATILYFLTIGLATDLMDGFVEADLEIGTIPDVSIVNYILAIYTVTLVGSFAVSIGFLLHDKRRGLALLLMGLFWAALVLTVSFAGLMGHPNFQMSPEKWAIAPALFATFVIGNPANFVFIEAICIAVAFVVIATLVRLKE